MDAVRGLMVMVLVALVSCASGVRAQDGMAAGGEVPSLEGIIWQGPGVNPYAWRGKTVVVLVYATWCPKCNVWSGELMKQLKEAVAGKPVVVVALNADQRNRPTMEYMLQREFVAPNIIHGFDPMAVQRFGFQSDLFEYLLVGPDGKVRERGEAGSFYQTPQGNKFALPVDLLKIRNLGRFEVVTADAKGVFAELLWAMELGLACNQDSLLLARKKLGAEDQAKLNDLVTKMLDRQIDELKQLYDGDMPDRIKAYEQAVVLAKDFPGCPQGQTARNACLAMENDGSIKREVAAKNYYQKSVQRATDEPTRQRALRGVAGRFKDTHYGNRAADELAALERAS